jgi:hypothetical protein
MPKPKVLALVMAGGDDCVVAAGALVERAVLDRGVRVGPGAGGDGQGGRLAHDGHREQVT